MRHPVVWYFVSPPLFSTILSALTSPAMVILLGVCPFAASCVLVLHHCLVDSSRYLGLHSTQYLPRTLEKVSFTKLSQHPVLDVHCYAKLVSLFI